VCAQSIIGATQNRLAGSAPVFAVSAAWFRCVLVSLLLSIYCLFYAILVFSVLQISYKKGRVALWLQLFRVLGVMVPSLGGLMYVFGAKGR